MTRNEEDDWFAPKRYGYGTGLPLTWQAWAMTASYCLAITAGALLLAEAHPLVFAIIAIATTGAFLLICAQKTRGGWRWRWGERD